MSENPNPLLSGAPLHIANVGIELIGENLERQDVKVVQVRWHPPVRHDEELTALLDTLL
ncbi:hypothetical protein [Komagataeibacter oboediens]|uniref:FdrA domain protein n=1 Tax=Komagataeibacter oboediens TaxID=65958 RepID=A0ABS5SNT4_9PROT|nr:hypothetical protein [Komagataeibacter oboediens]GBR37319.1 hypothetical protein AA11826_1651 [Komagataeibacter oboediens DSM 11826]MBL7233053.1 hypothetical protein [Komagataeibacter oboediens]MBT0675926.1 hypothetical protein [Komagataeibacter oboediens]MBT0677800.1 hypothetical protein [Komagataeibacter oboediens]MBV0888318.1 hypothetical protein [Komagataeibacter oboediens]